jgi:hypothetical protein
VTGTSPLVDTSVPGVAKPDTEAVQALQKASDHTVPSFVQSARVIEQYRPGRPTRYWRYAALSRPSCSILYHRDPVRQARASVAVGRGECRCDRGWLGSARRPEDLGAKPIALSPHLFYVCPASILITASMLGDKGRH